jgi:hypothetical protein
MAIKQSSRTSAEKELIKANAREQVANRKLDRLKERFEKLKVVSEAQLDKHAAEREKHDRRMQASLAENAELQSRCKSLQDEAAMWKAQLFEQLDRLDAKQAEFLEMQGELAQAQWQFVELVDQERAEAQIAQAQSQAQVVSLQKELVSMQSRVEGLKTMGSCLNAKLERATAQRRVLQREHARLSELAEMRASLLEIKDDEVERLKADLFEARRQILSHRLDSQSWDSLKAGLGDDQDGLPAQAWDVAHVIADTVVAPLPVAPRKGEGRRQLKLAALPAASSPEATVSPKGLLQRASKTLGGWFKLHPRG